MMVLWNIGKLKLIEIFYQQKPKKVRKELLAEKAQDELNNKEQKQAEKTHANAHSKKAKTTKT